MEKKKYKNPAVCLLWVELKRIHNLPFILHSREQKSLTVDFHPAENHVGRPAGPLWWC